VLDVVRDRRPATGVEVVAGVREPESATLLREFFIARRSEGAKRSEGDGRSEVEGPVTPSRG
jgi:hypothetical protein